ncbi:carboxypeptidase-like regulatory domain-containing protein [Tundrisphaera lichenicola]|uniref:carboxypeptidase-like regulatory domain-containing protein n=1 Tax=Tundrisphaera lichenicola TaxID=2029860 RepID=UPI003EBA1EB5
MNQNRREPGRRSWRLIVVGACFCALGCTPTDSEDEAPDYADLVPVKGIVKVDGKPLPGVVVTFLPPRWSASNGETDADGSYQLETAGKPGAFPGTYKVAISYLVSAEGEPQGLAPRSAMSPPPGMATAEEKLPPEYSNLGRTTLEAVIPEKGGSFDFEVKTSSPASHGSKQE